jgi:S-adenosylmethionine:tRNA ribosyltransferase-isomerase
MNNYINIQEYTYGLPPEKIAEHPLEVRDASKLLVYKNGNITHTVFNQLPELLPVNTLLIFNDTRVIPARILFTKDTGAAIEIFLLNPIAPSTIMAEVMNSKGCCTWQCTIGNLKRWKDTALKKNCEGVNLKATLINRAENIVEFTWDNTYTFAEMVTRAGITPLPPYIKRDASANDVKRYQTIYSHYDGAVAAPTAGLHFTENVFSDLLKKGIEHDFVTLHVSAGTFQPVKVENALEHTMHHEQVVISKSTLEELLNSDKIVVAVGTTSMRTLESLYWFGVKLMNNPQSEFNITQDDAYQYKITPNPSEALQAVFNHMNRRHLDTLIGNTAIYIHPGYTFKICKGLITNFHLPASTLMLLVASFVGPHWKTIYTEALNNNYRFLSYGDSSLLLPGIL